MRLQKIIEAERAEFERRREERELAEKKKKEEEELQKKLKDEKFKHHAEEIKPVAAKFQEEKMAKAKVAYQKKLVFSMNHLNSFL
jgi:hypothetical protein